MDVYSWFRGITVKFWGHCFSPLKQRRHISSTTWKKDNEGLNTDGDMGYSPFNFSEGYFLSFTVFLVPLFIFLLAEPPAGRRGRSWWKGGNTPNAKCIVGILRINNAVQSPPHKTNTLLNLLCFHGSNAPAPLPLGNMKTFAGLCVVLSVSTQMHNPKHKNISL